MISYLISDNTDTLVGMRLADITGVVLKTREEALEEFNHEPSFYTISDVEVINL